MKTFKEIGKRLKRVKLGRFEGFANENGGFGEVKPRMIPVRIVSEDYKNMNEALNELGIDMLRGDI